MIDLDRYRVHILPKSGHISLDAHVLVAYIAKLQFMCRRHERLSCPPALGFSDSQAHDNTSKSSITRLCLYENYSCKEQLTSVTGCVLFNSSCLAGGN